MRTPNRNGSVLVLTLFLGVGLVWLALLVADVGRAAVASQKTQTLADVCVLSSVRLRVEALEKIAARWLEFGPLFGAALPDGAVRLPSKNWTIVAQKAADLKKALPGYQGRSTAVIKVVAEANGIARESVEGLSDAGAKIGLVAESAPVRDELDRATSIVGGWLRRQWAGSERLAEPVERNVFRVNSRVPTFHGQAWAVSRRAAAQVRWDVDKQDPAIQSRGNGGYPRTWGEAIDGDRLDPNRFAVYRVDLTEDPL